MGSWFAGFVFGEEGRMARQPGFLDLDDRLKRLSDLGDQLEAYNQAVDFEIFRADLDRALSYSDGSKGGLPPCDPVMMFKILIIQAQHNLSDGEPFRPPSVRGLWRTPSS